MTALILASGSVTRQTMLRAAGVEVVCEKPAVDEDEVKHALRAEGAKAIQVADTLAELKAQRVSRRHRDAYVIGADQMLECGGIWFDKPADADHAFAHLRALSGRSHALISAVVVCRGGERIWGENDSARLTIRDLSDEFIRSYLAAIGPAAFESVGAYQLEGRGAQLFTRVEGDFFTILGLPLLPLLAFLRLHGLIPT